MVKERERERERERGESVKLYFFFPFGNRERYLKKNAPGKIKSRRIAGIFSYFLVFFLLDSVG